MTVLAFLSLAIWLVLLFARGRFWQVAPDMLPDGAGGPYPGECADGADRTLVAIVPARNEADLIGETLPTLLSQALAMRLHVLLVDDHSEDGTASAARRAAVSCGRAERLTIVSAGPLRPGWTGKLAAMQAGLDHARSTGLPSDRVLFTDADIAYAPGTLARLVDEADRRRVVLASLMVRLRAKSTAERWLVPAFVYFFRMLYPFAFVNDPRRRTAAAAGGAMLVDPAALERAGGLAAVGGALIDDCALGALMKRQGTIWLGLASDVVSVRAYPAYADIRAMVVRSAYTQLRHSPIRLLVAILGLALVFAVPPAAALFAHGAGQSAGLLGWAAMTLSFVPMLRFYAVPVWRAAFLPSIAAVYGLFTLQSALAHRGGRGGLWKGRVQAPSASNGTERPLRVRP